VFGQPLLASFSLASLGTRGFRIDGPAGQILSANDVAGAGDVNGDGLSDLIVGAAETDFHATNSGSAYVVFGKRNTTPVDLDNLGDGGFRIDGPSAFAFAGHSVAGAGDFNGDGKDDVIVGAPLADNLHRGLETGAAYIVFGKSTTSTVDLAHLGRGGVTIDGPRPQDRAGYDVAGLGDFSGDGRADVAVITDFGFEPSPRAPTAYVIRGRSGLFRVDLRPSGAA
jgi:hypothetical protein